MADLVVVPPDLEDGLLGSVRGGEEDQVGDAARRDDKVDLEIELVACGSGDSAPGRSAMGEPCGTISTRS